MERGCSEKLDSSAKSWQLSEEVWHQTLYSNLVPGQEVPEGI